MQFGTREQVLPYFWKATTMNTKEVTIVILFKVFCEDCIQSPGDLILKLNLFLEILFVISAKLRVEKR